MQTRTQHPAPLRRITEKMLSAKFAAEAHPLTDTPRSEIIATLHKARRAVGLTCQQAELLAFLASRTREDDWHSEGNPVSIASNYEIGERFDIGRTRVKTLLRSLAEAGWLIHRDSPNGHRYRRVHPSGVGTVYAYGLDLSPLSRRYPELKAAAEAAAERRREGNRLHYEVMSLARRIYDLATAAQEMGMPEEEAADYGKQAHELTLLRGQERDPAQLSPLCEQLVALLEALEIRASSFQSVESDPRGSPDRPHYTNTNPDNYINVKKGTRFARHAQEPSRNRSANPSKISSPLKGFKVSSQMILHMAPDFREFCSSSTPSRQEIQQAALFATNKLGISRHAWGQATNVLGEYETAVVIAIISARTAEGQIKSPGGYLRAMIDRQLNGQLNLDKTLYGMKG